MKRFIYILIIVILASSLSFVLYTEKLRAASPKPIKYTATTGDKHIITNLKNYGYGRLRVVFTSADGEKIQKLDENNYVSRNIINSILKDMPLIEGEISMEEVREKIKNNVEKETGIRDLDVYFNEFVIQK